MKVTVKLFATFRFGRQKIMELELPEGTTPREIIKDLDIQEAEVAILLINGRDGDFSRPLVEGDILSLFPPVGGG